MSRPQRDPFAHFGIGTALDEGGGQSDRSSRIETSMAEERGSKQLASPVRAESLASREKMLDGHDDSCEQMRSLTPYETPFSPLIASLAINVILDTFERQGVGVRLPAGRWRRLSPSNTSNEDLLELLKRLQELRSQRAR